MAECAYQLGLHYFDLTEDTAVTAQVKQLAVDAKGAFVPQCGLAPGFVGIVAHTLMREFETVDTVKLRVGALPQHASNGLQYALNWSTEGLINEYGNECHAICDGQMVTLAALEGLENLALDGELYEAFNTSGGLGSLPEMFADQVNNMSYKTIRYPGHCEKMKFLVRDLRLNEDRATLQTILERALPTTAQDMVLVFVSVNGQHGGRFLEKSYVKKIYPQTIADLPWSAIQVTTAAGVCAVADTILKQADAFRGFVNQEQLTLEQVTNNRFGQYYL